MTDVAIFTVLTLWTNLSDSSRETSSKAPLPSPVAGDFADNSLKPSSAKKRKKNIPQTNASRVLITADVTLLRNRILFLFPEAPQAAVPQTDSEDLAGIDLNLVQGVLQDVFLHKSPGVVSQTVFELPGLCP